MLNNYARTCTPRPRHVLLRAGLNKCITEVCTLLESKLSCQKIDVVLSLSAIGDIPVDPWRIRQILLNLFENSVHAIGQEGSIRISTTSDTNSVIMAISDTGCGMAPAIKDRIFDPFFTTRADGTGLELHICKSIVDECGGSIEADSTPGKGTTFIIRFPTN